MRTIWKYRVDITDGKQVIKMPLSARPLSFQLQGDLPFMWVELNTDDPVIDFIFEIFGTNYEISPCDSLYYVGTIVWEKLVWHLYQHIQ